MVLDVGQVEILEPLTYFSSLFFSKFYD